METLYTLTPREVDALSNLDQSDVIATGPWRKGACSLAHRAVIRDRGSDELVVHTQIVGKSRAYYEHGHYCTDSDPSVRLEKALVAFDKKIRLHHSLPVFTRE